MVDIHCTVLYAASGEPVVFIDNAGGEHSFAEIYEKMKALPNK